MCGIINKCCFLLGIHSINRAGFIKGKHWWIHLQWTEVTKTRCDTLSSLPWSSATPFLTVGLLKWPPLVVNELTAHLNFKKRGAEYILKE